MAHSGAKLDAFLEPDLVQVETCSKVTMFNNLRNVPGLRECPGAAWMLLHLAEKRWSVKDFFEALHQTFIRYELWAAANRYPGVEETLGDDFPDLLKAMVVDEVGITAATSYWAKEG